MLLQNRILIAFTVVILSALEGIAQTESVVHFEEEMRSVIVQARDAGIRSLTFRINAFQMDGVRGEKRKVKVTFLNDSVFERQIRFTKEVFVIRNGTVYPYDPETRIPPAIPSLRIIDSANCKVIWGAAYEGMIDSSCISYCRFTYDSLHREIDYYYRYRSLCFHRITQYESDSVSTVDFWQSHADTMRLMFNQYRYESTNADKSFTVRVIKQRSLPNEIRTVDGDLWMEYRTYTTYNSSGLVLTVRQEEGVRFTRRENHQDLWHTMSVAYHGVDRRR